MLTVKVTEPRNKMRLLINGSHTPFKFGGNVAAMMYLHIENLHN